MGKVLIIAGIILIVAGLIIHYGVRIPFLGKLPGDIYIERGNTKFYFPLATSIVVSIVLSLILLLISKIRQ